MTEDALSPRQIKRRLAAMARDRQRGLERALRSLLTTEEGRHLVNWFLEATGLGQSTFTGNALTSAFQQGKEDIAKQFLALALDVAPEEFLLMMRTNASERRDIDHLQRIASGEPGPGDDADPDE